MKDRRFFNRLLLHIDCVAFIHPDLEIIVNLKDISEEGICIESNILNLPINVDDIVAFNTLDSFNYLDTKNVTSIISGKMKVTRVSKEKGKLIIAGILIHPNDELRYYIKNKKVSKFMELLK